MQTDYLISGAGATALSFLDVILTETDASVVIVDRRDAPGGHWNDAYPFVRLHQSASFYGVPSKPLGPPRDPAVPFDPDRELSSKSEILHYFHDLMENTYLPTGRVTYLRMSEHLGGGRVRHLITGVETQIEVRRKIVNAGTLGDLGSIPATHTPSFEISDGATCVPVNDLPAQAAAFEHFTVVGAGKTGMDAAVWLLDQGVDPARITWVRPNDYWLFQREQIINHPDYFQQTMGAFLSEVKALASVSNTEDFCDEMEQTGVWHRIDPNVRPTKFHAAVCSARELGLLQQITDVVRKGHLRRIESGQMVLAEGKVSATANTLYIDCTARGGAVVGRDHPPAFQGDTINLFMVRPFQPLFSAALIGFLEAHVTDEDLCNACTGMVNFHDTPRQYIAQQLRAMMNQAAWSSIPELKTWIDGCRLYAVNHLLAGLGPTDTDKLELLGRFGPASKAAAENIPNILAAEG